MKTCCVKSSWLSLLVGFAVVGAATTGFVVGRYSPNSASLGSAGLDAENLPLFKIDATASAIGDEFSMATGPVSPEAEGIFVLDHASGLLQCNVLYPRTGQFGAAFQTNVKEALAGAGGKNAKYLMVTGAAQFQRGSGNCAVYVLDQSSGAYACFGIPFNEAAVNARAPQMGIMPVLAVGQARVALDRDALR
jgi:hypothetical protein